MYSKNINIAILHAVPEVYWADDGGITDAQKFVDLLAPLNPEAKFDIYDISEDQFPNSIDEYQGILVTGSPASVHDDFNWIQRLADLIILADEKNKRIVASCFGHQLIAKTFGGEVSANENGWLIGNYQLNITRKFDWMSDMVEQTGLYHFNQERVTRLPDDAISFASAEEYSDFAYTLGDNILSVQGHPEQPLRAMNNFLDATVHQMEPPAIEKARAKIDDGLPDAQIWGQWMMGFWLAAHETG